MMARKISDREYVLRLLVMLEGKTNGMKAQKIATLLGGRIRQRLMNYGKIPRDPVAPSSTSRPAPSQFVAPHEGK